MRMNKIEDELFLPLMIRTFVKNRQATLIESHFHHRTHCFNSSEPGNLYHFIERTLFFSSRSFCFLHWNHSILEVSFEHFDLKYAKPWLKLDSMKYEKQWRQLLALEARGGW
uniref:Uncharacterized protein n=1 Tax=Opuntia streptacantha TaxID=393608 RepID=A0A7C9ECD4_OPUST